MNIRDLTDKRFGKLKVLQLSHIVKQPSEGRRGAHWKCICACGQLCVKSSGALLSGDTKSCGCLQKEKGTENGRQNKKNILGKKFGRLTVVKEAVSNKGIFWECLCRCGKVCIVSGRALRARNTRSCGCLWTDTFKKQKGARNFNYNHSLTAEDRNSNIRNRNPRTILWRNRVFLRDNYTCQLTRQRGGRLCAHHLSAWSRSPSLRFATANGITLSEKIHKLFHKLYGKGQNTKKQFLVFTQRFNKGEFQQLL